MSKTYSMPLDLERSMAQIIKLSTISEETIGDIIRQQTQTREEIGGKINLTPENELEFTLIESSSTKLINQGLQALETQQYRDKQSIQFLYDYYKLVSSAHFEYLDPQNQDALLLQTMDTFFKAILMGKENLISAQMRKKLPIYYKALISDRSYRATFQELGVTESTFMGKFHTHPDGTQPSPGDLMFNTECHIPDVVISISHDLTTLHLISGGKSEIICEINTSSF